MSCSNERQPAYNDRCVGFANRVKSVQVVYLGIPPVCERLRRAMGAIPDWLPGWFELRLSGSQWMSRQDRQALGDAMFSLRSRQSRLSVQYQAWAKVNPHVARGPIGSVLMPFYDKYFDRPVLLDVRQPHTQRFHIRDTDGNFFDVDRPAVSPERYRDLLLGSWKVPER